MPTNSWLRSPLTHVGRCPGIRLSWTRAVDISIRTIRIVNPNRAAIAQAAGISVVDRPINAIAGTVTRIAGQGIECKQAVGAGITGPNFTQQFHLGDLHAVNTTAHWPANGRE